MFQTILIDTSGLFCRHDKSDAQNAEAKKHFDSATRKISHSYVLAEFTALAETRRLPRLSALQYAQELLDNPSLGVIWVDERIHREAISLLKARMDKSYSLCDAVSFVLMRELDITQALTTNQHFQQEGFIKLLD